MMERDVSYYLSRGFEQQWAEYFACGRKRMVDVKPSELLTLDATFDDGSVRRFDCTALAQPGTVFERLLDPRVLLPCVS